jgi:beta-glucosidase
VQRLGKRRVRVTVTVANTGARAGAEVVQVYLGFPGSTGEPPNQLKGFAKVRLEPGRRTRARVTLERAAFAHWSEASHEWVVTPGAYAVRAGTSSRTLPLEASLKVR